MSTKQEEKAEKQQEWDSMLVSPVAGSRVLYSRSVNRTARIAVRPQLGCVVHHRCLMGGSAKVAVPRAKSSKHVRLVQV